MRFLLHLMLLGLVTGVLLTGLARATKPEETSETVAKGKAIFNQVCLFCHGAKGEGDGPAGFWFAAYTAPRPRIFTQNAFKFRSTPTGELPSDQDLFRTVTNGVAGFMPPFAGLTEEERWQVIAYVKTFNPDFKKAARQPMELAFPPIPSSAQSIGRGRLLFQKQCQVCHGADGRGDGPLFQQGQVKEHFDLPAPPRDLTNRFSYKNGALPQDIFRTIMTGLDGGAMPGFAEAFSGHEEDLWDVVNYVLSLSRNNLP